MSLEQIAKQTGAANTASNVLAEIQRKYAAQQSQAYNRFLLYGGSGSGKTYSLRTAKKPLFIDSFDPGGSVALADLVEKGEALVISEYEKEDARRPSAFVSWDNAFDKLERANAFSQIGTYVLDSATTWAQAILNEVLKRASRTAGVPQQNDWYPQMVLMEAAIKRILSLPCDVVFICHDDILKDEITGKIMRSPLLTGKTKKRIPLLFSEIYYADVKRSSKGAEYVWQIKKDSTSEARSRLAGLPGVKLDEFIPQDFQSLMRAVGHPYEDLPPIKG